MNFSAEFGFALACGFGGLLVCLILTPRIRAIALRRGLLDRATQFHGHHAIAVPRIGGVALMAAFLLAWAGISLVAPRLGLPLGDHPTAILLTCAAMFALGFRDDLRPLRAKTKLLAQIGIALAAYLLGLRIGHWTNFFTLSTQPLGWLDLPVTVFWLVGATNLINLVDGLDGLAAGVVFILMVLLAILSGASGNFFLLCLCVGMAGALFGFLFFNFPPAKIFMGDGGAYFLGLLVAEVATVNANKGTVAMALMVPFFALGLPIIDTSFSILRRFLVGLPIFRADRRHIHHRLSAMGFSQRHAVLLLYALCVLFSLLAAGVFVGKGRWLPILIAAFMLVVLASARAFGYVHNWYRLGHLLSTAVLRRRHTKYALSLARLLMTEAERSASLEDLQEHFGMMLCKLEFQSATLRLGSKEWKWARPGAPEHVAPQRQFVQDLGVPENSRLFLMADAERWDPDTLRLLAELAAEAWVNASARFVAARDAATKSLPR
ncbi:MAG: undecaprenyl/decaprenyl-phosphate alpha-N-acetylglucosaminyl 1-phosphate transferase [Verrucomicrobiae bacterium]|nr:undecaprenyl/decaprenyl-phosphate alpha-N-acetylglucosaminyl 1-phosphate transferase [Verrucomicrobiae bacterium]